MNLARSLNRPTSVVKKAVTRSMGMLLHLNSVKTLRS